MARKTGAGSSKRKDKSQKPSSSSSSAVVRSPSTNAAAANDDDTDNGLSIAFFHPDLGIGGAERLVVDAAVGLQERGHKVVIFTNHCDPNHCFEECRDGTLDVRVRASSLIPMSILGRLTILCAILRHIHLILLITLTGELNSLRPRALIVDQLSAGLPLLQYLYPASRILFYCHFPDLLLARGRDASALKRLYRVPFDSIEQWSMGFAHAVAVNSLFTRGVVASTWPKLTESVSLKVVYPSVDTSPAALSESRRASDKVLRNEKVLLSINRFERKKDIGLAIRAFASIPEDKRRGVRLVLAGGYDNRIDENVQYHTELQELATSLSLAHHTITPEVSASSSSPSDALSGIPNPSEAPVLFLLSVPGPLKAALLRAARLLVYTPSNEHFGIVPVEAMLAKVPVLAARSGGPVESVVDGTTGWLRDPDAPSEWSSVMSHALSLDDASLKAIGDAGVQRVRDVFGRDRMAEALEDIVGDMLSALPRSPPWFNAFLNLLVVVFAFAGGLLMARLYWMINPV